ncbi:MAG: hypothetical protein Q4D62_04615 [Planctomycetia bacterium]|nr:hypothetical protein [Planctomycetia bacterium]
MKYLERRIGSVLALWLSLALTVQAADIGPKWQIGDRWSVETQTIQTPASQKSERSRGVVWNFHVAGEEKVGEQDCFRVEITCADTRRKQPNVTIWVGRQTGMLTRLTSRIPMEGKYAEYTESYSMADGVPTPVLGIIPSLPLDLPILTEAARNSKSLEPAVYESVSGSGQTKNLNDVRFAYSVTQTISPVPQNRIKSLSENIHASESVQVRISAGQHDVEQVWTAEKPWPIYSNNGVSVSRLKNFIPADQKEGE